jgi:uncharacterized delta-60 repeat protein
MISAAYRPSPTASLATYARALVSTLALLASASACAVPGDLDATFSGDGKFNISVTSGSDEAAAMALQPDGKLVIAGTCNGDDIVRFCLVRLDGDGTLDTGFGLLGGTSGRITDGDDTVRAIAIAPDGKIVVAGYCFSNNKYDFCVARFLQNGARDNSFNSDGKVVTAVTSEANLAYAVAIQPDGKIVVAGECGLSTFRDFCVVRYRLDGSLDPAFSGNGKLATDIVRDDHAYAVAIQADDKIVVAGGCSESTSNSDKGFCVVRYSANGTVESGFPKRFSYISSGQSEVRSIALQPDGKLVLGGFCSDGLSGRACLLRLEATGLTDTTFTYGMQSGACDEGRAVAMQPDGKIVMAGTQGLYEFCVSLYNSDGTLDASFSDDGRVNISILSDDNFANALAVQPDGRIVVSGRCKNASESFQFCAARFEGGAMGYRACSLDIDGDGKVLATTDSLIHARIALGLSGDAVIAGIAFPSNAKRKTWGDNSASDIRKYLVTQCGMQFLQ